MGRTETYIHMEGRGNRTQVEHMRTGADNHKGGKQDQDRKWRKKTHKEQKLQNKTGNRTQEVGKHETPEQVIYKHKHRDKHKEVIIKLKTLFIKRQK